VSNFNQAACAIKVQAAVLFVFCGGLVGDLTGKQKERFLSTFSVLAIRSKGSVPSVSAL